MTMGLYSRFQRRHGTASLGKCHSKIGRLATHKAGNLLLVFATNEDMDQIVAIDDELLEIMVTIIFQSPGLFEDAFDGYNILPLIKVCGSSGQQFNHLRRLGESTDLMPSNMPLDRSM